MVGATCLASKANLHIQTHERAQHQEVCRAVLSARFRLRALAVHMALPGIPTEGEKQEGVLTSERVDWPKQASRNCYLPLRWSSPKK